MFNFYEFLRKKWSEYSAASGQKGTVIDELAVKPTGLVMADFYNLLVDQRTVNDIENWEDMTREQLAFFGNKFFQPIIDGKYAFGSVRIWFDEKKDITISEETRFASNTGLRYKALQPGRISRNSFVTSSDRFALYYINVPIIAESAGSSYNVDANEISQITNNDFTYKMVSNIDAISSGSKNETAEEYYHRLKYTINDRSLMTKRSVFARLPELFPVVSSIYISGAGDRYMYRDLVSGLDISNQIQSADFLGKIAGENMVRHIGFYGNYPPDVNGSQRDDVETWGPFSIPTSYDYPLTIDPSNNASSDPAFHGYPLDQEFTQDMYKGIYFDEYKTFMELTTEDLFNIADESVGASPVVAPGPEWIYGANGKKRGNFGRLYDGVSDIDVLNFSGNTITMSGGCVNSISAGIDIKKRVGIKVSGKIKFPEVTEEGVAPAESDFQIMVGGRNGEYVDGYTGIGFGVRLVDVFVPEDEATTAILPRNATIYFAHSQKYDVQIFALNADINSTEITGMGALSETMWRIQPGIEYEFEFVVYDDLKLTLFINKTSERILFDETEQENQLHYMLPSSVLAVYGSEILKVDSTNYGTTLKLSLNTVAESADVKWIVDDLKAFDIQQSRSTALLAIDVNKMEDPVSIYLRAFGQGSVDGILSEGYSAYIWDRESSSIASREGELTDGGWVFLDEISNPTGSKDVLTQMLRHDIQNMERYKTKSRFGENIFLLIVASGKSKMNSAYAGSIQDDIQSFLRIDYVKVISQNSTYYHANNKCDIYVVTVNNSEELEVASVVLNKNAGETFFEMNLDSGCKMPIQDIVSVTVGESVSQTEALAQSNYSVVRPDPLISRSSKETVRIVLNEYDADTIAVEYTTYPAVEGIQDYFDGQDFGKIYGDVLVRHKYPVELSFSISFTGNVNDDQMVDEIRKYVDENIDGTFSIRDMVSYLYNQKLANNVKEPIEISYTKYNDEGDLETGTFTDFLTVRSVDFFRIVELTVNRL